MESPHRRFNLLTREWVLVSPHRAKRPWLGQVEKTPAGALSGYDPACYLCPGNERAGGVRNPSYTGTFAFDNDFSALLPDLPSKAHTDESPLLRSEPERGLCRVICFSPRHGLTLPELDLPLKRCLPPGQSNPPTSAPATSSGRCRCSKTKVR